MAIDRRDVDLDRVDFGDVTTGRRMAPIHPGRHLSRFMTELDIRPAQLARAIKVPVNRATAIMLGKRAISAETALRLGYFFGIRPQMWMNLQGAYDMARARRIVGSRPAREVVPRAA